MRSLAEDGRLAALKALLADWPDETIRPLAGTEALRARGFELPKNYVANRFFGMEKRGVLVRIRTGRQRIVRMHPKMVEVSTVRRVRLVLNSFEPGWAGPLVPYFIDLALPFRNNCSPHQVRSASVEATMRTFFAAALFTFAGLPLASACDLTQYDQVAPPALIGNLQNGDFAFVHASDAEILKTKNQTMTKIWNYVKNEGSQDLSIRWPLAGIITSSRRPLPSGRMSCNSYTITGSEERADDKAFIYFGFFDEAKQAPVYVTGDLASAPEMESVVESSYRDDHGQIVDYRVTVKLTSVWGGTVASIDVEPDTLSVYVGSPIVKKDNITTLGIASQKAGAVIDVVYPKTLDLNSPEPKLRAWAAAISEYNGGIQEKIQTSYKSNPASAYRMMSMFIDKNDPAIVYEGDASGVDFGSVSEKDAFSNALIFDEQGTFISSIPLGGWADLVQTPPK